MDRTLERIYLTLYWRSKAYGYPPSIADLAEYCGVAQTAIKNWLKRLAQAGYIQLFLYKDGQYNVKFLIEPKREWVVNIEKRGDNIIKITSEIPVKVYIHDGISPEPKMYLSRKSLDKAELIKRGIMV